MQTAYNDEKVHSVNSIARDYNCETIIPPIWLPPRFDRSDWQWIKNVAQSSWKNDAPIRNVKIGSGPSSLRLNCQHRTQPNRNCTIFYRRISDNCILLIGIGRHKGKGNKEYEVNWADGNTSIIKISTKSNSGAEYLVNPIGGKFGFETLDVNINREYLSI